MRIPWQQSVICKGDHSEMSSGKEDAVHNHNNFTLKIQML